jgi:hypothetical protein
MKQEFCSVSSSIARIGVSIQVLNLIISSKILDEVAFHSKSAWKKRVMYVRFGCVVLKKARKGKKSRKFEIKYLLYGFLRDKQQQEKI